MDCQICFSGQTKTRIVTCSSCNYPACSKCLEKYFETLTDAKCPNCPLIWTREFISINFHSFLPKYDRMGARKLLETEMALLPQTQTLVPVYRDSMSVRAELEVMEEKRSIIRKELEALNQAMSAKKDTLASCERTLAGVVVDVKQTPQVQAHVCNCPVADCRGFISKADYTCGICSTNICKKCLQPCSSSSKRRRIDAQAMSTAAQAMPEDYNHQCLDDDVQSATLILESTRACPRCAVLISKISGCDQMWCTQCHCAFSYKTGNIEKGGVHNPHYYNWLRLQKVEEPTAMATAGVPCQNLPQMNVDLVRQRFLHQALQRSFYEAETSVSEEHLISVKMWLLNMAVNAHFDTETVLVTNNQDLRLKYLNNEITLAQLGQKLQLRAKRADKLRERNELRNAFTGSFQAILFRFSQSCFVGSTVHQNHHINIRYAPMAELAKKEMMAEIERLIQFHNENAQNIAVKFNSIGKKLFYFIEQDNSFSTANDGFYTGSSSVFYVCARLKSRVSLKFE